MRHVGRFPSLLIKPDVRVSRIRLSDWLHDTAHDGAHQKSGPLPPSALPSLTGTMTLFDSRRGQSQSPRCGSNPHSPRVSPDDPDHPAHVPCSTTPAVRTRCSRRLHPHAARPSPHLSRVGVRIFAFETCSSFLRVAARRIAQPPTAAFVAKLQLNQLPSQTARQLLDQTDIYPHGSFIHW